MSELAMARLIAKAIRPAVTTAPIVLFESVLVPRRATRIVESGTAGASSGVEGDTDVDSIPA